MSLCIALLLKLVERIDLQHTDDIPQQLVLQRIITKAIVDWPRLQTQQRLWFTANDDDTVGATGGDCEM